MILRAPQPGASDGERAARLPSRNRVQCQKQIHAPLKADNPERPTITLGRSPGSLFTYHRPCAVQ